jgi:leader peptidase (prepilin peptidase)/N-methyltransferase
MDLLTITCALLALTSLLWMGWIDLKLWILPNELVTLFAVTALPFHYGLDWLYGGWLFLLLGGIVGGGTLLLIRHIANKHYGMETLGLGDVKLMAAAGLWLGPESVLMAMSVGAFMGVLHAVILAYKNNQSLNRMMLPAGPGFIAGILIIGFWTYKEILGL